VSAPAADPERPRRLLEEVLARPEFRRGGEDAGDWLEALLARLGGTVGDLPPVAGQLVTAVAVLLAGLLVWRLLAEGRTDRAAAAGMDRDGAAEETAEPAAAIRAAGLEAKRAGRFADAVVLLFRAMIARLAEQGLVLRDSSRTNREHVRDLAGRLREAEAVRAALPCFERVRYGRREAGSAEADRVAAAAAAVFGEGDAS
jgi:hypothetical protein